MSFTPSMTPAIVSNIASGQKQQQITVGTQAKYGHLTQPAEGFSYTINPEVYWFDTISAGQDATVLVENISIPNNATVSYAEIAWYTAVVQNGGVDFTIVGEDADDAPANPTTPTGWTLTSASVNYPTVDRGPGSTEWFYIPITSIVQEIVQRGGWAAGNGMQFWIQADQTPPDNTYRSVSTNISTQGFIFRFNWLF